MKALRTYDQVLKDRVSNIYGAQKRRAKENYQVIEYSRDQLFDFVLPWMGLSCPACGVVLYETNFSIDHENPISRGGSFKMENLAVLCGDCNLAKGAMTGKDFRELVIWLNGKDAGTKLDIMRRLKLGCQWRTNFGRTKSNTAGRSWEKQIYTPPRKAQ